MKDALHLTALHAFGIGASCDNLHLLGLPDEHGSCKEHVLHSVGQHIALLRVEDGEMKVPNRVIFNLTILFHSF